MPHTKYILATFDYELNSYDDDDDYIQLIIEKLRTAIYRNKSIQIAKRLLLIRVFEGDLNGYPYPKSLIDDVVSELISNEVFSYDDVKDLLYYCLPISVSDLKPFVNVFENEIKYLDALEK
ncbi:MAG: hypothetical protein H7239_02725 [Flavobacterium sp.]|nr:hypothetical protein [Flavobacterium sp.]